MIRIVIAEDQEMLLEAISSLLNIEEDIEVVGQAGNGEEALTLIHQLQPDVCIMDLEMPQKGGLEVAEALKSYDYKVIVMTTFGKTGYYQRALKANVRGYLLKDSPSDVLACSIRSIMDGGRIYSSELIDDVEREKEVSGLLPETTVASPKLQSKAMGTVRKYFTTIKDKIKRPAG